MYALSTLLFVSVLILLILINVSPNKKGSTDKTLNVKKSQKAVHFVLRKVVPAIMAVVVIAGGIFYSSKEDLSGTNQVIVYNWGEYLDPEDITLFEKETGINVVYEEFETNEIMYPKIQSGAIAYDVVCPSDYMIQRMIENDLLAELNFDNIPNVKNIGQEYFKQSRQFDSENKYSVPYCWGTVGILYNKTMVDEPIDSWSVLWDEKYMDNILMQDSVRDAFAVALKYKGHSLNSTNLDELEEAKELLIATETSRAGLCNRSGSRQNDRKRSGYRSNLFRRSNLYTTGKSKSGICHSKGGFQCLDRFLGNSKKC